MNDVETERDIEQQDDENQGPLRAARARLRETFHHAQDEARDMFDRVRRSFVDFINR